MPSCGVIFIVGLALMWAQRLPAADRGPLTPSSVDAGDAEAIAAEGGGDPAQIRQAILDGKLRAVYRDSDVRQLFPEIAPGEKRAFQCFNALVTPPSLEMAYPTKTDTEHLADVKTIHCKDLPQGMYCSLDVSSAYYLNDIWGFFSADGIPMDEALRVVELYEKRSSAIGKQPATSIPVDRVRKVNGGYELTLGREGCTCAGKAVVVLRSFLWFSWLTVIEEPSVQCV